MGKDQKMSRLLKSDWILLAIMSVVIGSAVIWEMNNIQIIDGPAVSAMIQYSVWWSVPWLYLAFATSAIRSLFPGSISPLLMRYRRFFGLCFSVGMTWQLTFIVWLVFGFTDYYINEVYLLSDVIIQIPGYIFLIAMTFTSLYPVRRRMNPKHWILLHKVGIYFLWQTVWSTYWYELYYYDDIQPIDYIYYWAGFFVWVFRLVSWALKKELTPIGKGFLFFSILFSSFAVIFASFWAQSAMDFFVLNPILVVFELAVPFLPIFVTALSVYLIVRWQAKEIRMSSDVVN